MNPLNASIPYEIVAPPHRLLVINAWGDGELAFYRCRPMRRATFVSIKHNTMAPSARTIECNPFGVGARTHHNRTIPWQPPRDAITRIDNTDDPPTENGEPLPPGNLGQVGHVCSRNGSVMPSPSLRLDGDNSGLLAEAQYS